MPPSHDRRASLHCHEKPDRTGSLLDIVDTQYMRTAHQGRHIQSHGPAKGIGGSNIKKPCYHGLTGKPYKQGDIENREFDKIVKHGIVLLKALSEAETRIGNDILDTRLTQFPYL